MSAALTALMLQAVAPNWQLVGPSPGGTTYYDAANTVIIDSAKRRVRIRQEYHEVQPNGTASMLILVEVDCVNRTGRLLEAQMLDPAGTVLGTRTMPPGQPPMEPVPRGGPEEAQLLRVCEGTRR